MPGFNYGGGNSIGGDSQFGKMGSNDPYGDNSAGVGAGGTGGANGNNNGSSGNSGANTGKTPAQILADAKAQISAGNIPAGWVLEDGQIKLVIPKHTENYPINGGGRGNDRIGTRTVQERHIANAELTAAYNAGVADRAAMQDAISFTNSFFKDVTDHLGVKAEQLARNLATNVEGHALKSFDAALGAFEKYRDDVFNKFSAADINAIKQSLASVDQSRLSTTLNHFSKAFQLAGYVQNSVDLLGEVKNSLATGDWHGTLVKANTIVANANIGALAGAALAIAAAPETAVTIGALSLFGAVAGSLVDDDTIEKAGQLIDSTFHIK